VLRELGKATEARDELKETIKRDPGFVWAHSSLAGLLLEYPDLLASESILSLIVQREDARSLPNAGPEIQRLLDVCREKVPSMETFASIDDIVDRPVVLLGAES